MRIREPLCLCVSVSLWFLTYAKGATDDHSKRFVAGRLVRNWRWCDGSDACPRFVRADGGSACHSIVKYAQNPRRVGTLGRQRRPEYIGSLWGRCLLPSAAEDWHSRIQC